MNNVAREHSIFLSYAHQDENWVAEFAKTLSAAGIHDYWFDKESLSPGDLWAEKIQDALRNSDTFIVFLSPNSLDNPNVFFEVGAAFANDKLIIPVLIDNVDQRRIPISLANRQYIQASSAKEAGKQVARIIEGNTHSSSKTK